MFYCISIEHGCHLLYVPGQEMSSAKRARRYTQLPVGHLIAPAVTVTVNVATSPGRCLALKSTMPEARTSKLTLGQVYWSTSFTVGVPLRVIVNLDPDSTRSFHETLLYRILFMSTLTSYFGIRFSLFIMSGALSICKTRCAVVVFWFPWSASPHLPTSTAPRD